MYNILSKIELYKLEGNCEEYPYDTRAGNAMPLVKSPHCSAHYLTQTICSSAYSLLIDRLIAVIACVAARIEVGEWKQLISGTSANYNVVWRTSIMSGGL